MENALFMMELFLVLNLFFNMMLIVNAIQIRRFAWAVSWDLFLIQLENANKDQSAAKLF